MRVQDTGDSETQMLLAVLGQESEKRGPCLGWGWTHFPEGFSAQQLCTQSWSLILALPSLNLSFRICKMGIIIIFVKCFKN